MKMNEKSHEQEIEDGLERANDAPRSAAAMQEVAAEYRRSTLRAKRALTAVHVLHCEECGLQLAARLHGLRALCDTCFTIVRSRERFAEMQAAKE